MARKWRPVIFFVYDTDRSGDLTLDEYASYEVEGQMMSDAGMSGDGMADTDTSGDGNVRR